MRFTITGWSKDEVEQRVKVAVKRPNTKLISEPRRIDDSNQYRSKWVAVLEMSR